MTALFVVIMTEQWMEIKNRKSVVIGLVCGLVCLLIFGAENFILPTMICIMIILLAGKRALAKDARETKDTLVDASSPDDAGDKIEGGGAAMPVSVGRSIAIILTVAGTIFLPD